MTVYGRKGLGVLLIGGPAVVVFWVTRPPEMGVLAFVKAMGIGFSLLVAVLGGINLLVSR